MKVPITALLLALLPSFSQAQDGLSRVEKRCARAAAHVAENLRIDDVVVGVPIEQIDGKSAVRHCKKAFRKNASLQNEFHLARAYLAGAEDPEYLELARALFESAAARGYAPAQLSLGYVLLSRAPADAARAAQNFGLAYEAGIGEARAGLAHAWGFGMNTQEHREKAVGIFRELGAEDPKNMLYGGEVLLQRMNDPSQAQAAEEMLLDAQRRGVNEAVLKLLRLYSAPTSTLKSHTQELKTARIAIHLGYAVGYESWVRSHVEKGDDYRNQIKTFQYASEGADAGSAYSAYIAGKMLLYGSGVEKDTFRAARFLEIASWNVHPEAKRLLQSGVAGQIRRLKHVPSYPAKSCVKPRRQAHDGKIIDYFNTCDHGIYALVCSRHVATELWSLLDNSDREYCNSKYVAAGGYIGNFYGADKESSLARKAISNVSVNIFACHPPLKPKRDYGETRCVE